MGDTETTRVTMLWPADLKEAVRAKVGQRGLTNFTLEAVREHLQSSVSKEAKDLDKEVSRLRFLVQVLADHLVLGGTHQDRREALMEVELPHWIQTNGWPADMAELVKPEFLEASTFSESLPEVPESSYPPEATPLPVEPEEEPEEEDEELHKPMFLTGKKKEPAPGAPPTPVDLPHDRQSSDLLAKIQAKAMEKGVDLDPAKLRPASQVPQPATPSVPDTGITVEDSYGERPVEYEMDPEIAAAYDVPPDQLHTIDPEYRDLVTPAEPARATPPLPRAEEPESAPADPNACPKCGLEMVDGECWSCF